MDSALALHPVAPGSILDIAEIYWRRCLEQLTDVQTHLVLASDEVSVTKKLSIKIMGLYEAFESFSNLVYLLKCK